MADKSKVYSWYYKGDSGSVVNDRPQIDKAPHVVAFSALTEGDTSQTVGGVIKNVTVQLQMRRSGSSTVSVESKFTLDNGTTTYSSDGWVSCTGITETSTKWHVLTMSGSNCPPASFFNAKNFTLRVQHQNASRSGIYCPASSRFILTVNYSTGSVYVYNGGWKEATPYVYTSSGWKLADISVYSGGWK